MHRTLKITWKCRAIRDIIVAAERKEKARRCAVYLKEVLERDDWNMLVLVSQGYTDDDLAGILRYYQEWRRISP